MDEIEDLYLSGIASAKAGNRRLAQAFFKRVIRINPRHEGAWLWLSEVLDDPDDIAYCLEAVLAINPKHEKAQMALKLVRERGESARQPRRPREWSALAELRDMDLPAILAQTPPPTPPPAVAEAPPPPKRHASVLWQAIFSLGVLMVLGLSVYLAVSTPEAKPVDVLDAPLPTIDVGALREQEREAIRAYFSQLDAILGTLRLATDVYRGQSNVRVSLAEQVEHIARLHAQVTGALEKMRALTPPKVLAQAHAEYIQGLVLEQEGLDNLLRFCETNQIGYSNRATVKIQEAGMHINRAKAVWAAYRESVGLPEPTRLPTPTPAVQPTYGPTPTLTPTFYPLRTPTPTPFPTKPIG